MRSERNWPTFCRLLLLLSALVLLEGCQPGVQPVPKRPMADLGRGGGDARLSVFLTLKEVDGPAVRMEVDDLEVLTDDLWIPVGVGPVELDSAAIGEGQVFLGGRGVPTGHYRRLRLTVTKGAVRQADGLYAVIADEPFRVEVVLAAPLQIERNDSRSLFITWDVQNSLEPGNVLRPALEAAPRVTQLLVNLVFVACTDIDTVFVIRADRNWVVDSFGLKGGPTYLALDPDPSRQRLYVLATREAMVKVVDLSSFRVVDFFPVPLGDVPVFMTISADGRWAYLLDERGSYLSRMDLATGRSAARVRLGPRPNYAAFLDEQNLLAVSLGISQKVQLLDPLSLAVVGDLATGSAPQGLLSTDSQLYVAESGDHMVSIIELASRRNLSRLAVGFGPRRLLATDSFIYVSNYDHGSLSVLVRGQLGVIREIHGLGRPLEMAFNPEYRRVYVGDDQAGGLAVIDSTANQLLGWIHLGARPLRLAVIR